MLFGGEVAGEQSSGRTLKGPPGKEEAFSPLDPNSGSSIRAGAGRLSS